MSTVIDDALIAKCRADRDRAPAAEREHFTRMLEFLSKYRGRTIEEMGAEIKAQHAEAEAELAVVKERHGRTNARYAAAMGGYFPTAGPTGGSYSLRATLAQEDAPRAPEPAARVLDRHVRLHALLGSPNSVITGTVRWFAEEFADPAGENDWLSKYMMWPYYVGGQRPRANWDTQLLGALSRGLFNAPTYQVTGEMCEVAEAMYEQTAKVNGHIEPHDLPSETGFLWLDEPFKRHDAEGDSYQTRLVTWSPQTLRRADGETVPGVRVTLWADWSADPELMTPKLLEDWAPWTTDCPLLMVMTTVLPFREDFGHVLDDGIPSPLHYVHAVWLLLGTEVAVTSRGTGIPRQAVKRAQQSIKQHEVRVVTLRRAIHREGDAPGERREIDWSCRWLVRGFWRHRWGYGTIGRFHEGQGDGGDPAHCMACGARVSWVAPYVKGPDDRPLKASETLYRLSR